MNLNVVVRLALLVSILVCLPVTTPAHADDPPKGSTTKPKQDAPKKDAPKKDAPKKDAPKKDASKTDPPKKDAPKKPPTEGSETKQPDKPGSSSAGDVPPRGYR